jgi:hypothetical protein
MGLDPARRGNLEGALQKVLKLPVRATRELAAA